MARNVKKKYAYLDQLSTARLLEILRADEDSSAPSDPDMLLHILDLIQHREEHAPSGLVPEMDVDQAWREFQEYYNIPEGDDMSLYPEEATEEDSPIAAAMENAHRHSTRGIRCLRRVGLVAAVVALLFAGMVTVQAMGLDVFGALARWTNDIFHFEETNAVDNSKLGKALIASDIDTDLMPTWSPDGFVACEPECTEQRSGIYINQDFIHPDGRSYTIEIVQFSSPEYISGTLLQKDGEAVEEYISNGRRVYVFSNLEHNTAAWAADLYQITVVGDLTRDELKQIFDSIGGTL